MIKDTELRKGNLLILNVSYKEVIHRVDEIYTDEAKVTSIEDGACFPCMSLRTCKPIPLTPDWLERCGLAENDRGYYVLVSGGFYLLKNDLKDETGAIDGFVLVAAGSHGLVQKPIYKHVHQLQNLFFALTGEELTIKEKV